jgi:hypothetical protein
MSLSDDAFAGLGGKSSAAHIPEQRPGWSSTGGRAAFWTVTAIGTILICLGWFWYGLSFFEEMTEQCKALAADSSMAGQGLLFAGTPLVFAHCVVLLPLLLIGAKYRSPRRAGILSAVVAVLVASALGIAVNELVWSGDLFAMSADAAQCS